MKVKAIFAALALVIGFAVNGAAQKIGYTNVELVLNYMPQTKDIEKQLGTYQKKLEEGLMVKQRYFESEKESYSMKAQQGMTKEEEEAAITKLNGLAQEIQRAVQTAEGQLARKRGELLKPLQDKMQKAIDEVAVSGGYTYILNNAVGSGVPSILYGTEANDVTDAIAKKLGIDIPTTDN